MILWKNDPAYLLNAANMHKSVADIIDFSGGNYLSRKSGETAKLEIAANTRIVINNDGTFKAFDIGSTAKELVEGDLDAGVFVVGTNYYVYLHDDGADAEVYIISANSTFPTSHGCNANNTRKIGGFHYGYERVSITVADVRAAIVPNSVWDLKHRPKCAPEGMVYLGGGVWVDIYLASVNEAITFNGGNGYPLLTGTAKSIYGATPLTGTEGLSGYNFNELARRSGKRLLSHGEWLAAAHGHPAGDQFAGNTATRGTNGEDADIGAVSFANVADCARKLWQWLDEFTIEQTSTSYAWQTPMAGMNVGQLYLPNATGLRQFITGGGWGSGADAGSRCVGLPYYPWLVSTSISSRFACDSL
jgi:hypothetical protein